MRNAYAVIQELREQLGESVAKHWSDLLILGTLIRVQDEINRKIQLQAADWLVKRSVALTPKDGLVALPSDIGKILSAELVEEGVPIVLSGISSREKCLYDTTLNGLQVSPYTAILMEDSLKILPEDFDQQIYVYYERNLPKVHAGTAAAGDLDSITFANDRHVEREDDYYNGAWIEIADGTGVGTKGIVVDYDGETRVATVKTGAWYDALGEEIHDVDDVTIYTSTGVTFDTTTVYGIVPQFTNGLDYWFMRSLQHLMFRPGSTLAKDYYYFVRDEANRLGDDFEEWLATRIKGDNRVRWTGAYDG